MNDMNTIGTWPVLRATDADAMIGFLVDILGFEQSVVYRDEADTVHHAELLWPGGGGLMLGTASSDSDVHPSQRPGGFSVYLVTQDPDALHGRACAAGIRIVTQPHDTDYGSREFALEDAEGNRWSFGTYGGHRAL